MESGNSNDRPQPKAAADSFEVSVGPGFLDGLPSQEDWLAFKERIEEPNSAVFAGLWQEKAKAENGVPLRSALSFRELVKYGKHLTLYKLTEEERWLTTFCGDEVVVNLGMELTGKHLDEYGCEETLKFWMSNMKYIRDQGRPYMETFTLDYVGKPYSVCRTLNLPLRSGNRDFPDMFVCYETYTSRNIGR